ncbi:MAG TPA: beta-mannosidase [Bacteroidales bacterium]|jgi:mannan endo-1,4-beta-mannosidase|nr:beta-mannosidase [Bacteroidales bacterium]
MKKTTLLFVALFLFSLGITSCNNTAGDIPFVHVENGQFIKDGQPYHFIGFNFWYAGILASEGTGGNRDRLHRELDFLKSSGVDNLRIMIGADGPENRAKVRPGLQTEPGVYNDTLLRGLDYLLVELGKRDMLAVLFFNNTWEWTGGYSQYLEWAGYGKAPVPVIDGWPAFQEYVGQYMGCVKCDSLFRNHLKNIITRVNSISGVPYIEEPAIMSWQIANEPRPMGADNKELYEKFILSTAEYIKSMDPNHMVSVGSEGSYGSENDMDLYRRVHQTEYVDYLTLHIWPKNWMWIDIRDIPGSVERASAAADKYLDEHIALAEELNKPIVLSEFGFPRDNHLYNREDPVTARNAFYEHIFNRLLESVKDSGPFSGCNIWAWGGFAQPRNVFWQPGDDYCGDPSQEEQGLNSVFAQDNTVSLIKSYVELIRQ